MGVWEALFFQPHIRQLSTGKMLALMVGFPRNGSPERFILYVASLLYLLGFTMFLCGCWTKNRGKKKPKWMMKMMENPMNKWMIWGYHYFWKHPYVSPIIHGFSGKWRSVWKVFTIYWRYTCFELNHDFWEEGYITLEIVQNIASQWRWWRWQWRSLMKIYDDDFPTGKR